MRTRQAFINTVTSIMLQAVLAISGIIVPRFFTELYGSSVNGLVSSISQFISYINLVEAGISAAGMVALYKPLADRDQKGINGVFSAADKFYKQSGLIFAALIGLLVIFYPFAVKNEIGDLGFIRTMIAVLSVSGIVDYFILGKYRMLLTADQRGYVISFAQILGTVIMTVVSIILMELECSALLVKAVAAAIYIFRSVIVVAYAKRYYKGLSLKEEPNTAAFSQRWAVLAHQIAGMVITNSAAILLTFFVAENALREVSVYALYNLVAYSLTSVLASIQTGLGAGFGQVISKNEKEVLHKSFRTYEFIFFIITFVAYSCVAVLLHPFVTLYSAGFDDAEVYARWPVVILFTISGFLQTIRIPAVTIITAAGHYKQTRNRAIAEAVINLTVSLILVRPFGIVGVVAGSCASYLYRTTDILYNNRHLVKGELKTTFTRIGRNLILSAGLIFGGIKLIPPVMDSWILWFLSAVAFGITAVIVYGGVNCIFEPNEFKSVISRFRDMLRRN